MYAPKLTKSLKHRSHKSNTSTHKQEQTSQLPECHTSWTTKISTKFPNAFAFSPCDPSHLKAVSTTQHHVDPPSSKDIPEATILSSVDFLRTRQQQRVKGSHPRRAAACMCGYHTTRHDGYIYRMCPPLKAATSVCVGCQHKIQRSLKRIRPTTTGSAVMCTVKLCGVWIRIRRKLEF